LTAKGPLSGFAWLCLPFVPLPCRLNGDDGCWLRSHGASETCDSSRRQAELFPPSPAGNEARGCGGGAPTWWVSAGVSSGGVCTVARTWRRWIGGGGSDVRANREPRGAPAMASGLDAGRSPRLCRWLPARAGWLVERSSAGPLLWHK